MTRFAALSAFDHLHAGNGIVAICFAPCACRIVKFVGVRRTNSVLGLHGSTGGLQTLDEMGLESRLVTKFDLAVVTEVSRRLGVPSPVIRWYRDLYPRC
jgi:hypothetical protein